MATTHKVYETTSTYKGRTLKVRTTLTDVDEDLSDEEALASIKRVVLPEGATNATIRNITSEDPIGPLAKVPLVKKDPTDGGTVTDTNAPGVSPK